mmetsp:Transcript_19794/g.22640  ORF Transcript_19794/g.22640 Transcript_19794/m.22640 type:complete len:392 (-) Transcript_19794:206-1381(-)
MTDFTTTAITGRRKSSLPTPWVERYRPKNLKEVSHQREVVATLQNAVETGRLPHLLLYGPPGTGKTSVALALCRQLWHPDEWRKRVLELNASDERGISVVRDKIKHFASLAVSKNVKTAKERAKAASNFFGSSTTTTIDEEKTTEEEEEENKYPNPPFKIIILDEADTVTKDAQSALRRVIEAHSRITRFILICNYVTRIIEPLASRCAKFRFQALPVDSMRQRLTDIGNAEGCSSELALSYDEILRLSRGDMRRAVTILQSAHALSVGGDPLSNSDLCELAGLPPPTVVDEIWSSLTTFDKLECAVRNVCAEGYSSQAVLVVLFQKVLQDNVLDDVSKSRISIRIAEAEQNLIDGADEYLQLMNVCSLALTCMMGAINDNNNNNSMSDDD